MHVNNTNDTFLNKLRTGDRDHPGVLSYDAVDTILVLSIILLFVEMAMHAQISTISHLFVLHVKMSKGTYLQ